MILRAILFFSMVMGILVGSHFYIAVRLLPALSLTGVAFKVGAWAFVALALSIVLSMMLSHSPLIGHALVDSLIWFGFAWMGLLLYLFMATVAGDVLNLLRLGLNHWTALNISVPVITSVRLSLYGIAAILAVLALIGGHRFPVLKEVPVEVKNLPSEFEGYRIAHITDTHIGPILRSKWVDRLVDSVNAAKPDLVVHTGDLVDGRVDHVGEMVQGFTRLQSKDGALFVSGNHEIYSQTGPWLERARAIGFKTLINQHVLIERKGKTLVVGGIPDRHEGRDSMGGVMANAQQAFAEAPPAIQSPRILLAHQPVQAQEAQGLNIDLQLSGHTHGGQFWPFHLFIPLQQPIVSGFGRIGDVRVFVSNGAGFWGPPLRLLAPAEVPILVLKRGE